MKTTYGLLIAFCLVLSFVYAESGCCLNPLVDDDVYCTHDLIDDSLCCSDPSHHFSVDRPYGPADEAECLSSYFHRGSSCVAFTEQCLIGCCCQPSGDHIEDIEQSRCDDLGGRFYDTAEECALECGVSDPSIPASACDDPSHEPLINLVVRPNRGIASFTLTWSDECSADSYRITRCLSGNCVEVGISSGRQYIDTSADLLWDTIYEYRIEGTYALQGFVSNDVLVSGQLGNLECEGREVSEIFCLHPGSYNRFADYLGRTNPSFLGDFSAEVETTYGNRFNRAYTCSAENILSVPILDCPENEICIVEGGSAACITASACQPDNLLDAPFGLYTSSDECHDLGYCYFDRGNTLVDKCYACDPGMTCYDYKSSDACSVDNCNVGNCQWQDISGELGIGVCLDRFIDNCQWCDSEGTVERESYNRVFDQCSEAKASALSTDLFPCLYSDGAAISCSSSICTDLDSVVGTSRCPGRIPQLLRDNSLAFTPQETCDLGVCQAFGSSCRKNANGDNVADCDIGDDACERDFIAPITELILERDVDEIVDSLSISIEDVSAFGILSNPTNLRTYLCIGSNNCLIKPGYQFSLFTEDSKLSVNGLKLSDYHTDRPISLLSEGSNTIYYFSEDASHNLGLVKTIEFNAYASSEKPEWYAIEVDKGIWIEDTIYTASRSPNFVIKFREGGAEILNVEIRDSSSTVVVSNAEFVVQPDAALDVEEYALLTPDSLALDEGEYTFHISAKNANNRPLAANQQQLSLIVNFSSSDAIITPPPVGFDGTYIVDESEVFVTIGFSVEVKLSSVTVNGENYLDLFSIGDEYQRNYSALLNLSDGSVVIGALGIDRFGNELIGSSQFIVNALPVTSQSLRIINPSFGVSDKDSFDLILESDKNFECRYVLDLDVSKDEFDTLMNPFDTSFGSSHIKSNLTLGDESIHTLYVTCRDVLVDDTLHTYVFDLSVDSSEPIILDLFSFPTSPIAESPINITLTALSDDLVQCRYHPTDVSYDRMGGHFSDFDSEDFRDKKQAFIYISRDGDYSYYVGCMNQAELLSENTKMDITVDSTIAFEIIDHTHEFQKSNKPTIAIETNKAATCKYSFVDPDVISGTRLTSSDPYIHTKELSVNASSGVYIVHVRCFPHRSSDSEKLSITFTLDTTSPFMEYVNDTSLNVNFSEISYHEDKLFVQWFATDNETGHRGLSYNYSLIESISKRALINWTLADHSDIENNRFEAWIDEDHNGEDLNLSDNTKYQFRVRAGNILQLWSTSLSSNGVTTDFDRDDVDTCDNNVKDGSETDVDCGGSCGPTCDNSDDCRTNSDCKSGFCDDSDSCSEADDDDNKKNGNETDVDCGGGSADKCDIGDSCREDSDCKSDLCKFNVCAENDDKCDDNKLSSGETDVDCGGICPDKCSEGQYCDDDADCESGLSCERALCSGGDSTTPTTDSNDSDGDGIPDDWETSNGLDPADPSDAELDWDVDGLNNYNEWIHNTNPSSADTDGDGFTDKEEVDGGSDPTDPDSTPARGSSRLWLYIVLILIVLGCLGYLGYTQYFKKKPIKSIPPPRTMPPKRMPPPKQPVHKPVHKPKKRPTVFDAFGPIKKEEKKVEEVKKEEESEGEYIDLTKVTKKPKDEVFDRLSTIIDSKKPKKDALKRVNELSAKASSDIKSDLSKHSKDIKTRLSNIEKKVSAVTKAGLVVSTPSGTRYHRPDCITLKKKAKGSLKRFDNAAAAKKKKLKACTVCMPK